MTDSTVADKENILEDNRIIFVSGDFDEEKAKETIEKLLEMEASDPTKDILMIIDSYGGHIHSLMAIHDTMKHLMRCDVVTIGIGKQMSCGQMLLISGTKGKRFATPNSCILMHQLSLLSFGKLQDVESRVEEDRRLQKMLEKIIMKYTNITRKQLSELMQKDLYITADQALKYGMIDGVIKSPKDLYNCPKIKF